jgi:CBS domain-containing protein
MATVHQLLTQKGFGVLSIGPDDTVYDAIKKMADENVGSLVVVEHGKLVGLITERHYSRNVFLKGRSSPQTKVAEVMERRRAVWTYRRSVPRCSRFGP